MKPAILDPSTAYPQTHGLAVEAEQLEAMVKLASAQLQQTLYPPDPSADLTQAEVDARQPLLMRLAHSSEEVAIAVRDVPTLIDPLPWYVSEDLSLALSRSPTTYTKVQMETTDDT